MRGKKKDPAFIDALREHAQRCMWQAEFSPGVIGLRNKLRRYKGFGQISNWSIQYNWNEWSENTERVVYGVKFNIGKQEWEVP